MNTILKESLLELKSETNSSLTLEDAFISGFTLGQSYMYDNTAKASFSKVKEFKEGLESTESADLVEQYAELVEKLLKEIKDKPRKTIRRKRIASKRLVQSDYENELDFETSSSRDLTKENSMEGSLKKQKMEETPKKEEEPM